MNVDKYLKEFCELNEFPVEYDSLENIHNSIINNKREVYSDDYLIGNLCPIYPDILGQEINKNELFYIIKLWNGDIMINQFVKI